MIFHQVHNAMKAAMNCCALTGGITIVLRHGTLAEARHVKCVINQLRHAFARLGANGNNSHTQLRFQLVDQHRPAIRGQLVHHIQRNHHGNIKFQQLHSQIQITFNIGGIHHANNAAQLAIEHRLARHQFLRRKRREGIHARQVNGASVRMIAQRRFIAINRYTGEVAHVQVFARELVK